LSESITIRKLIERLDSGDIRIPAFQRDFIWDPDQVAFLLDSIYKGFPIGTIILWKTEVRLKFEKKLGCFSLPEPRKDYPVNYILDGQQRVTSIFSVFQSELEPESDEWVDIYFDLEADNSIQESAFLALDNSDVDLRRHFPVKYLFNTIEYRKATSLFDDDTLIKIDNLQDAFKSYLVPNQVFETDDKNKVSIVFERINRAGTELDVFELLSAWSWSEEFDLVSEFDELQEEIIEHGFSELCDDKDLQLRICAAIIKGKTTPNDILELQGEEIRDKFNSIKKGIFGAIDFLKRELNVRNFNLLPFPGMFVPLCSFFATEKKDGFNYSSKQKNVIEKWFWRSAFSRRFSASVNARQAHDIKELNLLKNNEDHNFMFPKMELKFDFATNLFSIRAANTKSTILLLNTLTPNSLLSGANIVLDNVLKKGSKVEYHHIYPKKYLEDLGHSRREINILANICFLTRSDNNSIKAKAPSIYSESIPANKREEYLSKALIPTDFNNNNYSLFVDQRVEMLKKKACKLME
jgi:hypothetical protein